MKTFQFIPICFIALMACSTSDNSGINNPPIEPTIIDLSQPWQTASLSEVNIDELSQAVNEANAHPRMESLLVVRNGKLVLEEYFDGAQVNDLQDVRSVTKSVVSILTGIAIEKGLISSIDDPIGPYLANTTHDLTAEQQAIAIRDLLTMSSGFEWDEWTSDSYSQWIQSGMPVAYLLDLPFTSTPGSSFTYNSASTHLLGVVVSEAVGTGLDEFANTYLFNDLGITSYAWEFFNDGSINGGAGIDLRPRDLAKLGQLFLQNGLSGSEQLVPSSWVTSTTHPSYSWRFDYGALTQYTYGQLWWVRDANSNQDEAYLAWGHGGQYIFVVPAKDLIVVTTTNWVNSAAAGGAQALEQAALDVIINHVLSNVN
ncbi:MAG: beta-lactamase family protein [Bacteroidia bacterium]|nr:beta-lactamase family protein [Bacteroidia bacterium]